MDSFDAWVVDCCLLLPRMFIVRAVAYESYRAYVSGVFSSPLSENEFYSRMTEIPHVTATRCAVDKKFEKVFMGITLISEMVPPDDFIDEKEDW
jgi:hypothetical protein